MSEEQLNKLEREIEVIWNIIRLLKSCFWIHFENFQFHQVIATQRDIKKCTKELKKLIVARKNELGALKEPAKDVSQNRSGKSVF